MIDVGAGVVDADYRGPVGVVLFNFGPDDFVVEHGDRIAQLILEKVSMVSAMRVEDLEDTVRGEGGFGSTGVSTGSAKEEGGGGEKEKEKDGGEEEEGPEKKVRKRVVSPADDGDSGGGGGGEGGLDSAPMEP